MVKILEKSNRPSVDHERDPEIARRFVRWHRVKNLIEYGEWHKYVKEGEIYWAAVGQNVGSEIYGKGKNFARPIMVYRKLGKNDFLAIPLTSKKKQPGLWYVEFMHKSKRQTAALNQIKVMSVKRLYKYMGMVDDAGYARVREGMRKLYCENNP